MLLSNGKEETKTIWWRGILVKTTKGAGLSPALLCQKSSFLFSYLPKQEAWFTTLHYIVTASGVTVCTDTHIPMLVEQLRVNEKNAVFYVYGLYKARASISCE